MFDGRKLILFLVLAGSVGPVFFTASAGAANAQGRRGMIKIKLYFWNEENRNEDELIAVTRRLAFTRRVADAAVRELLKGETGAERAGGLGSDYRSQITGREECRPEIIKPLLAYYIGVNINKKGVATVNFRRPALCYFQTTIAMRTRVGNPLVTTLEQFKSIKEVQVAFDGELQTEWDA